MATDSQTSPPSVGGGQTAGKKRAPENLVFVLTLVAIGFVGLRILIVSRGDSDTTRALVQNLNVTAIVLATILPLMTTAVVLFFISGLLAGMNQIREPTKISSIGGKFGTMLSTVLFIAPPTVALCWFAMPTKYLIVAGVLGVALVVVYVGTWHSGAKNLFQGAGAVYVIFVMMAGLFVIFAQVGVWLPRERLSLGWWHTGTVYVLSSDSDWTKYLDDGTHRVRIVPTKEVRSRDSIAKPNTWPNLTASEIWNRP